MIEDNDLDKTQEFTIESDADYYGKNEELLKRHYDLQYTKRNTPTLPTREGTFPKGAPRYNQPPVKPEDYRKKATPHRIANNAKPHYPHKPDLPPKYKSNKHLSGRKNNKLPKALSLLLAAGIITGGIRAVTLGMDLSRDNALKESQENLAEISNRESNLRGIDIYQQKDDSVILLNADLNNLLQKFKESPDSVTQEEVRNLLGSCYQEGRDVAFSKMAEAYNKYSQENDEYPKTIEAEDLVYMVSDYEDYMTPCYIAYRPDEMKNPNGTALPSNSKLSDYISTQLKIKNLYFSNDTSLNVSDTLNLLKDGISDINDFYSSEFSIEKGLFGGRNLVIEQSEKNTELINYDEVENSQYSYTEDKDSGDR